MPSTMLIRGVSSEFSAGILYIIDGVYGANPDLLISNEIESFEILKDAASTARYGSQGAAGVIIINTKSYQGDKKLSVRFNSFLSYNQPAKKLDVLTADEFRSLADEYFPPANNNNGISTDWQDEVFRSTVSQNYDLRIGGKIKNTAYQVSVIHQNNPGIVTGSDRKITGTNISLTQSVLKDRLKLRASAYVTYSDAKLLPSYTNASNANRYNLFYNTFVRNPTEPVFNSDGTYYQNNSSFSYNNPLATIEYTTNTSNVTNTNLNFGANYTIMKGFDLDFNLGHINNSQSLKFKKNS